MGRMNETYIQYLVLEYKRIREKYLGRQKKSLEKIEASATMEIDGGAGSGNFNHAGRPGKVGGAAPAVSAEGENAPCTGFASKQKLKIHYRKHGAEVGAKNEKDYQQRGIAFLGQKCGADTIGYSYFCKEEKRTKVVRFNKKTTEYASGFPNEKICTYYKAKYDSRNHKARPDAAMKYYIAHKERDLNGENN